MNKSTAKVAPKKHSPGGKVNLTDKILFKAADKALRTAATKAMQTMGFVIKTENGWLVREESDGTIHKIKKLKAIKSKIVLD